MGNDYRDCEAISFYSFSDKFILSKIVIEFLVTVVGPIIVSNSLLDTSVSNKFRVG